MSERVYNTHDQLRHALAAGLSAPYALVRDYVGHRTSYFSGWKVYHPTKATEPSKTTSVGLGWRTFSRMGQSDRTGSEALAAAKDWVAETYGYRGEWKRNRQGDYVPAEIQKRWPIGDNDRTASGLKVFSWQGSRSEAPGRRQTRELCAMPSKAALLRLLGTTEARLFNLRSTSGPDDTAAAIAQPGVVLWYGLDERPPVYRVAKDVS